MGLSVAFLPVWSFHSPLWSPSGKVSPMYPWFLPHLSCCLPAQSFLLYPICHYNQIFPFFPLSYPIPGSPKYRGPALGKCHQCWRNTLSLPSTVCGTWLLKCCSVLMVGKVSLCFDLLWFFKSPCFYGVRCTDGTCEGVEAVTWLTLISEHLVKMSCKWEAVSICIERGVG
jgi:hypothetical protein